jgi:chemotaxis protein CheD
MQEGTMRRPAGPEVVVGVGDCRFAQYPDGALATYALGSCLAIIAFDWKIRLGGLLHVMLPDSSIDRAAAGRNPFVYVDTGVPELIRRIEEKGGLKRRMRCSVVGGASMMADSSHFEIGKRNYLALKKAFWKQGLFIDTEDVGGTESRSVRLDLATGRVDLRKGAAPGRILTPAAISLMGSMKDNAGIAG